MNGFPIEWTADLYLARKWRYDFAIMDEEIDIIQLPRKIARKIWICLYAEEVLYNTSWADEPQRRQHQILQEFRIGSNCHGIVDWLMGDFSHWMQWYDIQFPMNIDYSAKFTITDLDEAIKTWGFPVFATHWTDSYFCKDHSMVILWMPKTDEFIVFEKQWCQGLPFRIYLQDRAKITEEFSRFATYAKTA